MSLLELFGWPAALPSLLLAPLLGLALLALDRRRARRLARAVGPRERVLAAELGPGRRRLRRGLATAALLCALLAVTQPLWGSATHVVRPRGADLLVCLDVSRSMLASDLRPSRLARAREEIRALAARVRGGRLGLVAFAGDARLLVPLTHDMASYAELVELADPLSVGRGGTDLGAALETALRSLPADGDGRPAILLITDGEDLEGRGLLAAAACAERRVTVHCAGFGSERGSKIALAEAGGPAFLRSRSGEEVVSAMDATALRAIADATGGAFVDAAAAPRPLVDLYRNHAAAGRGAARDAEQRRERGNRFQWPLLAAFVLWILELALTDRRRP